MGLNKCAHPNCEAQKPVEQYACRGHWFSLPKPIRDKIGRGYRLNADAWLKAHEEAQRYWMDKAPKGAVDKAKRSN